MKKLKLDQYGLEPYDAKDPLSIPPFLRMTAEARKAAWVAHDAAKTAAEAASRPKTPRYRGRKA